MGIPGRYLTEDDIYLLHEGTHTKLPEVLGAHVVPDRGGTQFAVWAPAAKSVSVIGTFNGWRSDASYMQRSEGGIWQLFVPGAYAGSHYKFHVENASGFHADKADPMGFFCENSPQTASIVWDLSYQWNDSDWLARRRQSNGLNAPMCIYEVHLGSWRRVPEENNRSLSYKETAEQLVPYVKEMGFTHVELMPIMEHPFYGSWGYQTTGYFAPTSRYGTPQDLMALIDLLHQNDIGVILDWVPSHFPQDEHGPGYFDGADEYEPADPRTRIQPDWNSFTFDYSRNEVRSFLLSSALFWLDVYHADGLRVDAVASMLYLDYSRAAGQWTPNPNGGRENLEAVSFLKRMNQDVYGAHPNAQTFAEESTAWPLVSRPVSVGGLGFGFKWDMGWMHDTLQYMAYDPVYRKFHHGELTFRMVYAFNENFVLPLSHDEVVYGKGSLLGKMPGEAWKKFANLRLLFAYMYALPGKKLIFMGGEFGQWKEWAHDSSLDWHLLHLPEHAAMRLLVGDLNHVYRSEPCLYKNETSTTCFQWINPTDAERNVLSFLRLDGDGNWILVACNFSAAPRDSYRLGVPAKGWWQEMVNTDATVYGGSGRGNFGGVSSVPFPLHGRAQSITVELPPLAAVFFKHVSIAPVELARSLTAAGKTQRDNGELNLAQQTYEQAAEVYRTLNEPLALAHTIRHVGDIAREQKQWETSARSYAEALDIYRKHPQTKALDLANAIAGFARLKVNIGDKEQAKAMWVEARELYLSLRVQAGVDEADTQIGLLPND